MVINFTHGISQTLCIQVRIILKFRKSLMKEKSGSARFQKVLSDISINRNIFYERSPPPPILEYRSSVRKDTAQFFVEGKRCES